MQKAQDREPGKHEKHEIGHARRQLADDHLAIGEVGCKHIFKRTAFFFFRDGAGGADRRQQEHSYKLDGHEGVEECLAEARQRLDRHGRGLP